MSSPRLTNSVLDDVVWQAEVMRLNMMCNDNVIFVAKALSRLAMQRGDAVSSLFTNGHSSVLAACIGKCVRSCVFFLQSIGLEGGLFLKGKNTLLIFGIALRD